MRLTPETFLVGMLASISITTAIVAGWPRLVMLQSTIKNNAALSQRYATCVPVALPVASNQPTSIIPGNTVCHAGSGTTGHVLQNHTIGYVLQGDSIQLSNQLTQRGY